MDNRETLLSIISDPLQVPSLDWVNYMLTKYPYFVTPAILMLERGKNSMPKETYDDMLLHVALNVSNRKDLNIRLENDQEQFNNFYQEHEPMATPDTNSAIDKFLDTFGKIDEKETKALENAIFNPVPEYGLSLDDDDSDNLPQQPQDSQDALIASFLDKNPVNQQDNDDSECIKAISEMDADKVPEPNAIPDDDDDEEEAMEEEVHEEKTKATESKDISLHREENVTLTESLANVYIKQRRYAKAYDMLLEVSKQSGHHNPYLADQLRFLKKLIKLSE